MSDETIPPAERDTLPPMSSESLPPPPVAYPERIPEWVFHLTERFAQVTRDAFDEKLEPVIRRLEKLEKLDDEVRELRKRVRRLERKVAPGGES